MDERFDALLDWLDKPHVDERWARLAFFLPEGFSDLENPMGRQLRYYDAIQEAIEALEPKSFGPLGDQALALPDTAAIRRRLTEVLLGADEGEEPSFVAETLAWCNTRRADKGMEPLDRMPKGLRSDPSSCPCGAATGLYVGMTRWGDDKRVYRSHPTDLPRSVMTFVRVFDDGELPQYDQVETP